MTTNFYRAAVLTFFLSATAGAADAKLIKKVEGTEKMNDVTLTQSIEMEELGGAKLKSVAHALRNKKVAFMNFKVYVGELLMPADSSWTQKPSEFLSSSPAGFQMTMLRDVPAEKMMNAFNDSLKENEVDVKSEPVKAFLAAVKKIGDLKEKDAFLIVRKKAEKTDDVLVYIAGREKEIVSGPSGWSDNILKIWAGKPADAGLENMQKEIFK